ncbi:hypothetical protein SLEP1_g989 [Rubroshorea leprosula]|uniref:Uncharacterized protein n=1 Tax=Rubroshorea leprosula TaxID=152421 RepID=A0AAV5HH24_9ROSI|nr:hypothetical protein SLEP1_g989 [Rubroshorea leprosula]
MVGDMRSTSAHLKAYIESPVKSIVLLGRLVGWVISIMSGMNGIILVKSPIKVPKKSLDYPFNACRAC